MKNLIKILQLENNHQSVALIHNELQNQGINFISKVTVVKKEFADALINFTPDIILSEYSLKDFSAADALKVLKSTSLKIPFLIVTSISIEEARQLFDKGADDYVSKDRLNRLGKAVTNSISKYDIEKKYEALKKQVKEKENAKNETLDELNRKFELITKITSDVIWDWDLVTGNVYRSRNNYNEMLNFSFLHEPYCTAEEWENRIHPNDREEANKLKQSILKSKNKNTFHFTCRVKTGNGGYAYIEDNGYIIRDAAGKPVRMVGASKNITEKKVQEDELQQLSLIAKETSTAIVITDAQQNILWVNNAFTHITEYSLAEARNKRPGDLLQGIETNPVTIRYMRIKCANKKPFKCDVLNYSKSGRRHWIRLQCHPQFDKEGMHTGFFAFQTDITKEKTIEEQLTFSTERYRHLFNNSPACIFLWDIDTLNILETNKTCNNLYGYTQEEFSQLNIYDLRPKEEFYRINELIKTLREQPGFAADGVWKHLTKKGDVLYMHITSHRIDYKGRVVMMAMATNITDKILLQKKLAKEKKIKQKEITSAVITAQEKERKILGSELHDNVNQILASALLYLGVSKKLYPAATVLNEADKLIYDAIKEIRNLSHMLITPLLDEKSLKESLESLFSITENSSKIVIHKNFECLNQFDISNKLKLNIYRITQEQFTNILKHAKAGNIYFNLHCTEKEVLLTIIDDGQGFDTAKKTEGVGLINIKTRASLFNGTVQLLSSPGNGCELKVSFEL